MSNNKQSSVEWFFKWVNDNYEATNIEFANAFEQAKAMQKNEYFEFFKAGQESMEEGGKGFEQYYNEKYGKDNQPI